MENITAEIFELAGNAARDNKSKRIIPRHIQLEVRNDEEINKLFAKQTIASGGAIQNIHNALLPDTGLHAIVDVLQNGVQSLPAAASGAAAHCDPRESFEENQRRLWFLSHATLEELNSLSISDWEAFLYEFDTGFNSFFWNFNVRDMDEDHVIEILEVMKSKQQRFFEPTHLETTHHHRVWFLSRRIQDWVSENYNEIVYR